MTLPGFVLGQPRYQPSTPWGAWLAALATVTILILSQFGAYILVLLLTSDSPASGGSDSPDGGQVLLLLLATQAAVVVLVLLAASFFGGRPRDVLKLGAIDGGLTSIGYAMVLMAGLLGLLNAVLYWLQSDVLSDMEQYLHLVRSEPWLLSVLAIGIGAPLMEELLFRGFLLSALARSRLGFAPAAVLTTGAWTALHWGYSVVGLLEVFGVGLYFSWLLWRTGSLWPPLICHAVYNTGLVLVLRYAPLPA
jgi:membrane protease YdiL (CAAX protease family)